MKLIRWLLRRPWDRLQILTAAQTHLLRCSLGQRPLRASSRVRASHLHLWRSPSFVAYPTVSSVSLSSLITALAVMSLTPSDGAQIKVQNATASSSEGSSEPLAAMDGDRFSTNASRIWRGAADGKRWFWSVKFDHPRKIGSILQIQGDHDFVLRHVPRDYLWQTSVDGRNWVDLPETTVAEESRIYRIHRLKRAVSATYLRLSIGSATGGFPVLREVEFYDAIRERIPFPPWIIAVNTTERPSLPSHGQEFIPLARSCPGWESLQAQQIWLGSFNPKFIQIEPRPTAAFLSGNFKDWCEISREPWRGTQEILRRARLPMWASCGGAQGLAILAETGVDRAWDCPHCRDPKNPKLPIYGHIGHTGKRPCGDYSACVFERGPHQVRKVSGDPVFEGLSENFEVMESHCGQIEWPPAGWRLTATAGSGNLTKVQCLRLRNRPIYAAQFHIEMEGTPATSRKIMGNFLRIADEWNQSRGR